MFLLAINHKEDIATVIPTGDHSSIGLSFNCQCTFASHIFNTLADIKQYIKLNFPECSISLELFDDTQVSVMQQCPDLSVSERDQIVETLITKQQSDDLSVDDTVTRFIDSDHDSEIACDLYQIIFPDSYVSWLNSGLSRYQFVESVYYPN